MREQHISLFPLSFPLDKGSHSTATQNSFPAALVVADGASTGWGCKLCFADGVTSKKDA